jgi:D-sedoheptulose 7-phosphate isomerase
MKKEITNYLSSLKSTLENTNIEEIENVAKLFISTRDSNKQIFVFGNGGSGSTASHMVCDIIKGCSYEKEKRFRIICLNDNIPTLLAYSNDVGYDYVFLEQLKNLMNEGDLVLGISGSGNSLNVIKALEYANAEGGNTIAFTGFSGGKLKKIANNNVHVNIDDMQISEDLHVIVMHIIYKLLNK